MATHSVITQDYHSLELAPGKVLYETKYVWEFPVRLTHWVSAAAITVLFATGLFITYPFAGPRGEAFNNFLMGRVRETHFIAGYALLASMILRCYWFFVGNNYARSGFPRMWQRE